jgi:YggT family protein
MLFAAAVNFINLFVFVFNIVLLVRVVMSWFNPTFEGRIGRLFFDLTEPLLVPIRRVLPQSQSLDFSPLVAFILLELISGLANWIAGGGA